MHKLLLLFFTLSSILFSDLIYSPQNTNVLLTFDVSESMVLKEHGGKVVVEGEETTRFDLLKKSAINMIETYKEAGNVNVNLTIFAKDAKNIGWMSAQEAIKYFQTLTISEDAKHIYANSLEIDLDTQGTDYHNALNLTSDIGFQNHSADKTVCLFVTGANPNSNKTKADSSDDNAVKNWKLFVDENVDELFVLGMGSKVSYKYLDVIQTKRGRKSYITKDETILEDILVSTAEMTIKIDETAMIENGYAKNSYGTWIKEVDTTVAIPKKKKVTQKKVVQKKVTQKKAASTSSDKIEIFATKMDTKDNIVEASGDVAVVYQDYYLSATKAVYNRTTGDLELFDNVRANKGGKYKVIGNYAKLNIISKERSFKPFYMLEEDTKVWISAAKGHTKDRKLDISSGVVSSCEPTNPLWQMEFSSSDYDFDSKWLNLYNTRFYMYDIPIFYTPWFGYSLDDTRRTGLLMPSFGYSSTEGAFYEQPIYIAEQNWWDLELKPQLRTNRGTGMYGTFRFADSKISKGELDFGYFKEKSKYVSEHDLANDTHHGFSFNYDNADFLNQWFGADFDGQSGIYVDINNMSDVEYINLASSNTIETSTANQTISRINMFYNTDSNYIGTYLKYYQNLNLDNNDDVIQQLPTVHYHNYLNTLLDNHLSYSVDIKSNNLHRKTNKKVTQTDLNIPVSLHTTMLGEHLDLSFKTNLYAQHSKFSGNEVVSSTDEYKNGYIVKNDNILSASTQLTKAYEDFTHVIGFGVGYYFDGSERKTGFYEYNKEFCADVLNSEDSRCEFYGIDDNVEETKFEFSQYIYDSIGKEILYHRIAQAFNHENSDRLGDLENEIDYLIIDSIRIYNNIFYNHYKNEISKSLTRLSYEDYGLNLAFSHLYRNTFLEETTTYTPITNYITSSIKYNLNSNYSFHAAYDYDLEINEKKRAEIGFMYRKRCWDFGISYVENNRPKLTSSGGIDNDYDRYIFFNIILKPFMSQGSSPFFAYKLPTSEED